MRGEVVGAARRWRREEEEEEEGEKASGNTLRCTTGKYKKVWDFLFPFFSLSLFVL